MTATSETAIKKPTIRQSGIESFTRCGEAYRRRYLEGEIIPPGIAPLTGTAFHAGARVNFKQKIESHADLPAKEIIEAAVAEFDAITTGGYILTDEEVGIGHKRVLGMAKDQLAGLAELYARQIAPDYQPVYVEQGFTIALPAASHDLSGTMDLADDKRIVTDFKTAGKRKNAQEAAASVQLTAYAAAYKMLTGEMPTAVRLETLVKKRQPERQILESTRSVEDFTALAHRINAVLKAIDAGIFTPATPGAWWCHPKWCGFHSTCKFVNGQAEAVVLVDLNPHLPKSKSEASGPRNPSIDTSSVSPVKPTKRKKSYRNPREKLLDQDPHCRWCGCTLTKRTATLDHIVPLGQGGKNEEKNYCLSCEPHNSIRGDSGLHPKDVK